MAAAHFGIVTAETIGYDVAVLRASGYGRVAVLLTAGILTESPISHAVLFKDTGDPSYNTNAPTGSLTNSGWQYEGQWIGFLGTPIAPTFFAAAQHIGGSTGSVFVLNGFSYHTIAYFDCPNSDLRVWQVAETFPLYAPLYMASNEVGQVCVVFGRGTQRGNSITVGGQSKGWAWGASDGVERWGENVVSSVYTDASVGQLLQARFDRNGITNECQLSTGDSSGAMFIQDGGTWKLAGVHYAVSNPFVSTNGANGSGFNAALLDYGGLYLGGDGNWALITNQVADIAAFFDSTRISSHVEWINNVINLQPGIDLRITAIQRVSNNIVINFATGSNKVYRVDWRNDLKTGVWATLTNGIVGTGGIMTATDVGAASPPQRFYRLQLVP